MMKDTEIHKGLPQWEIRQLIAHDIRTTFQMEAENKQKTARYDKENIWDYVIEDCRNAIENKQKTARYDKENIWDYVIEDCRNAIEFNQKRLKIAELRKGLHMLLALHGWEEFDISEENIRIELGQTHYLSFIGTEAEHKALLKKLYPKK